MSQSPKKSAPAGAVASDVPFEEALHELEAVVEAMEGDDLPLETLLARYEEGVKWLETCQAKLAAAAVRISQLEQAACGSAVLTPLSPGTEQATE